MRKLKFLRMHSTSHIAGIQGLGEIKQAINSNDLTLKPTMLALESGVEVKFRGKARLDMFIPWGMIQVAVFQDTLPTEEELEEMKKPKIAPAATASVELSANDTIAALEKARLSQ